MANRREVGAVPEARPARLHRGAGCAPPGLVVQVPLRGAWGACAPSRAESRRDGERAARAAAAPARGVGGSSRREQALGREVCGAGALCDRMRLRAGAR